LREPTSKGREGKAEGKGEEGREGKEEEGKGREETGENDLTVAYSWLGHGFIVLLVSLSLANQMLH